MAGEITALLDALSPEDFAATLAELGVEPAPAEGETAEAEGAESPEDEAAEEVDGAPPSSKRGGIPTAEEMSTAAQSAEAELAGYLAQVEDASERIGEVDKGAAKKLDKLAGQIEKLGKDASKASEKAQKAASKEDAAGALEAATEAEAACAEAKELLAEAMTIAGAVEMPVEEGSAPPAAPGAAPAKGAPAAAKKAGPAPFEAWASRE